MCRLLHFFSSVSVHLKTRAKKIGSLSGAKLWSSFLSRLTWVSTRGRRRRHAWKEPVGSCWYPAPRTEKGMLTLSHLVALAEASFDASWPWYLDLSFITEPSFVSCLSLQCCSLQEMRGKLKVWRELFHTYLQGRIGGWDTFKQAPFLAPEGGCLFLYIWGRLISFSKSSALKQRDIHSHRTWSLKDLSRDRRKTPQGFWRLSYLGLVFHSLWFIFFMKGWKSHHIN